MNKSFDLGKYRTPSTPFLPKIGKSKLIIYTPAKVQKEPHQQGNISYESNQSHNTENHPLTDLVIKDLERENKIMIFKIHQLSREYETTYKTYNPNSKAKGEKNEEGNNDALLTNIK